MNNGNDALMDIGGTPWAKWEDKGDKVTGTIVEGPKLRQSRDYETGRPATFESGDPKMEIVVIIQTDERNPEYDEDNGKRQVVMRKGKNMHIAVRNAVKKAGAAGIEEGGTLTLTHGGAEKKKSQSGLAYTERNFTAKYVPPKTVTEEDAIDALSGLTG